ncbi:putative oxidoreductase [Sphingobium sp. SYK-6]|uniref:aldo/keto reductase n=1 Tax=Sphingobium sp. (strain NBRC 103272 / SYK-6) TaxID=627192 RepID=UPI0002277347|nr:aldo/keto reductase [Sphingobium sp. SYK-6]BAK66521.1 putative oxidoreductase [Sphingobium sp. SYK-6]
MKYKLFGRTGLRVSEIALGTATFGTRWGWGADREASRVLFDRFVEAGGNFFDCADGYQNGESESLLGEFIRSDRDAFAISTKYTSAAGAKSLLKTGNSLKGMMHSLEGSLKRLGTDYVDLFWVHFSDLVTPTEEIMRGFDDVVRSGKARYVGFSDFPAWRVARAATIAELRGWAPVTAVQVEFSLAERSAEREFFPMADGLGLAVVIWAALGGGILTGKYRRGEAGRRERGGGAVRGMSGEQESRIIEAIEAVGRGAGASPAQVAIAWVRAKTAAYTGSTAMPIIGARTLEQLDDNLGALPLVLDEAHVEMLDAASAQPLGFPHELLTRDTMQSVQTGGYWSDLIKPSQTIA